MTTTSRKLAQSKRLHKIPPIAVGSLVHQKYRIVACISKEVDCCNKVFKALDIQTGTHVALKVVRVRDRSDLSDYNSETSILQECNHINIIRLLDFTFEPGNKRAILVYELYGNSLTTLNAYPPSLVKRVIYQLIRAVEYLHIRDIIHRDIKPENILIDRDSQVIKLIDFGSCTRYQPTDKPKRQHNFRTPNYEPPESKLRTLRHTPAYDIWSIGCVWVYLSNQKRDLYDIGDDWHDELFNMFEVLGTPTKRDWPEFHKLPKYQDLYRVYREIPDYEPDLWEDIVPNLEPEGRDILKQMLVYDPKKRITASQALKYPYFDDVRF